MSQVEILNNFYEVVFQGLKTMVTGNTSLYGCKMFKSPPETSYYPHAQLLITDKSLGNESLSKTQQQFAFEFTVEIYAQGKDVHRSVIATAIEKAIADYMLNTLGVSLIVSTPIPNLDQNLYRILMRFTGIYDMERHIIFRA